MIFMNKGVLYNTKESEVAIRSFKREGYEDSWRLYKTPNSNWFIVRISNYLGNIMKKCAECEPTMLEESVALELLLKHISDNNELERLLN